MASLKQKKTRLVVVEGSDGQDCGGRVIGGQEGMALGRGQRSQITEWEHLGTTEISGNVGEGHAWGGPMVLVQRHVIRGMDKSVLKAAGVEDKVRTLRGLSHVA